MLDELLLSGMTDAGVAREISTDEDQIAPSIVNRWRRGIHKRTSYDRYIRIRDLHTRIKTAT